jgi:hypothetical protein
VANNFCESERICKQTAEQKSGLIPVVHFVLFLTFSRSFLPPFSFVSPHVLYLSFVVASFIFLPSLFVPLKKAGLSSDEKKQTATCVLAVAQPPAINLNRNANAKVNYLFRYRFTFSVAVTRSHPFFSSCLLASRSAVAVSDRNTATRSAKKSFLRVGIYNAFFASLGVFIVKPHTNALRLFAHFFGRSRTCQCITKTSSKKIEHPMKANQLRQVINLMFRLFCMG